MKLLSGHGLWLTVVLLVLLTVLCTQLPLFNYVGFEFSTVLALTAGFLAGLFAVRSSSPKISPARSALQSSVTMLFALVPPLALMLLNGFIVKNCSLEQGMLFFLLLPVPAVLFSVTLGVSLSTFLKGWHKTAFTILYLIILLHVAFVTFAFPQIFAFNPIVGFFPGVTYDESIDVMGRLALYRGTTILAAGVLLLASQSLFQRKSSGRKKMSPLEKGFVLSGSLVLIAIFFLSDILGFSSSEASIKRELGGEITSDHFVISYPADRLSPEEVDDLVALHEFYFASIVRELRVVPRRKIHTFLYASPEQKGRLVGAAGTNIAKPWLWQLHLNLRDVEGSLKHELVHVMAAEFGFPLLRVGLNSGLIEGLAMAVEGVEYDETIHRLAAQIYAVGLHPDVESLFSVSGFFRAHGGTSYVIAGSFCRFLIDQYGIRRFRWLYRTGSFESFYRKDLEKLIAEWRRFLDRQDPSRQELAKAAFLFQRPSIFGKECARVIAAVNAETRDALRTKRNEEALRLSERSLELSRSPEAIVQHVNALFRLKRYEDAIQFSFESMKDSTLGHVLVPLYLTLGDAYWSLGLPAEAKQMYEMLYAIHLTLAWDEGVGMRMAALDDPWTVKNMREYFVGQMADSVRMQWLHDAVSKTPSSLVRYALGKEQIGAKRLNDAVATLDGIREMKSGVLEFSRHRLLGKASFDLRRYEKAKMYFWESLNFTSKTAHQLETQEWLSRCEWMEEYEAVKDRK